MSAFLSIERIQVHVVETLLHEQQEPFIIVLFHNDISPSGEQPKQRILSHKL